MVLSILLDFFGSDDVFATSGGLVVLTSEVDF